MIVKIPQNQKFKKFNRSTCFRATKLIRLVKNKTSLLRKFYSVGLVSVEQKNLTFNQLKTIFQVVAKHAKFKRKKIKKSLNTSGSSASDSAVNLLDAGNQKNCLLSARANLKFCKNIRNFFNKKKSTKKTIFTLIKVKKKSSRIFKKKNFSLLIQPRFQVTSKPLGIRMGKGKGAVDFWQAPIKKGQVIFLFRKDLNFEKILNSLIQVQKRIPIKTKIIYC